MDSEVRIQEFIGLYELTQCSKGYFALFEYYTSNVRSQCYDGASNTSGKRSGVANEVMEEQPLAFICTAMGIP